MNTAESGQRMSVDPELHDAKRGVFRSISDRGGSRMRKGPIARNRSRVKSTTQEPRWNGTAFWNRYTALIGPGYCDTTESMVSSVTPSTVACATKILSKGSF